MTDIHNNIEGEELQYNLACHDPLFKLKPFEVDGWVDFHVDDLDDAKDMMAKIIKLLVVLNRKNH